MVYMAILSVFGERTWAIHLGLLLVNAVCTGCLFLLGRRLFDAATGLFAAVFFALFTLSSRTEGLSANAEHFVLLAVLPGLLFLLRAMPLDWSRPPRRGQLAWSGLLFGIAVVMKQQAVFLLGSATACIVHGCMVRRMNAWGTAKAMLLFVGASLLPYAGVCVLFLNAGVFKEFQWWTMEYPRHYGAGIGAGAGWNFFLRSVTPLLGAFPILLLLAAAGGAGLRGPHLRGTRFFLIATVAGSLCALVPGYQFFAHYYLLMAPVIALLGARGVDFLARRPWLAKASDRPHTGVQFALCTAAVAFPIIAQQDLYFQLPPDAVSRELFTTNPFPESVPIAQYLKAHTRPTDRIAIIGSEPQILFHADRRSATGFLYLYEMFRKHPFAHGFQTTMMQEVRAADPAFVVFVHVPSSWLSGADPNPDGFLEAHALQFIQERYTQLGTVDISWPERGRTTYCWNTTGTVCTPQHQTWIGVYRRTTGAAPPDGQGKP